MRLSACKKSIIPGTLVFLVLVFACLTQNLYSQQLYFRNFTPDDGLPGSEVHGMFQDQLGYMWFSTDMGISRFDGNKMVVYNTTNGLPENGILNFFVESPDKVWLYSVSHNVYYFNPLAKKKQFIRHPISDPLREMMQSTEVARAYIRNAYFLEDHSCILTFLTTVGYLHIDSKGKITLHKKGSHTQYATKELAICLDFLQSGQQKVPVNNFEPRDSSPAYQMDWHIRLPDKREFGIQTEKKSFTYQFGVVDHFFDADTCYVAFGRYIVKITPDNFIYTVLPFEALKLEQWRGDLLAGTFGGCFSLNQNLEIKETILANYTVDNICVDHEGGLWLATLQQGVFYHPPQDIKILSAPGYTPTAAIHIARNSEYMVVSNYNRNVVAFPLNLKGDAIPVADVTYMGFYQAKQRGLEKYLGKLVTSVPEREIYTYSPHNSEEKKITGWSGNTFYMFDFRGHRTHYTKTPRINDVAEINDSLHVVATVEGVYQLLLEEDTVFHSEFLWGAGRVFNTVCYHNGVLLLGSDDDGIYLLKDNHFTRFGMERGILSDQILDIEMVSDTSFWVATSAGMNYVVFGKNGEYNIDMITTGHGLTSNEVATLNVVNDTVWVAHKKGVCFFDQRNIPGKDEMNPGFFYTDSIKINNYSEAVKQQQTIKLGYTDNLDLYVTQIAFANGKTISYRYRMSPGDDWIPCDGNHIFISGTDYGDFQLEIQAVAGAGNWTSLRIPLIVGKPFWLWPEFYLILLLFLLLVTWGSYQVILRRVQKKRDAEYERAQLEIKSIVAQMNPHFTFNTINSIQSYIINHGTRDAVLYLSDFATLIRKTLDYSRTEFISLEEELEFLKLYVDLEKKRFRNIFEFIMELKLITPVQHIKWPPLMLQPLIENSIVHALSNVEFGKIELKIEEEKNWFIVILTDNGKEKKDNPAKKMKSSVGLEILRDRVRLHNGSDYVMEDLQYGHYESDTNSGWITKIKLYKL